MGFSFRMSELACKWFGCPNAFTGGRSSPSGRTVLLLKKEVIHILWSFWWESKVELRTVWPVREDSSRANVETGCSFQMSELTCRWFGCPNVFTGKRTDQGERTVRHRTETCIGRTVRPGGAYSGPILAHQPCTVETGEG